MNAKIKSGIIFLSGVVTGAVGAFAYFKAKLQKDFDAKREEMIRYFETKKAEITKSEEEPVKEEPKNEKSSDEVKKYEKVIMKNNYSAISSQGRTKNDSPSLNDDYNDIPYEIDPREFGSQEMYGMVTFYLYDDGEILTDKYELLDDESIENYIGTKNLQKLANMRDENPELDAYYIRNDRLKIDCEIIIGAENIEEPVT